MTIEALKEKIESNSLSNSFIILVSPQHNFIPMQYIRQIKKNRNIESQFVDDFSGVDTSQDIFGTSYSYEGLSILLTDKLEELSLPADKLNDFIVVTKTISDEVRANYSDYIVDIPTLSNWHIKDFVYSNLEGISEEKLDWLISIVKGDIYRLQQEINKLSVFSKEELPYVFDDCVSDGMFDDVSTYNIFNFSNAIMKKDISGLLAVYKEIENADVEPLGLLTILYNNFKNVISVQLSNNPTPESTGLTSKQFWAVKYSCGVYTSSQLQNIFSMLTAVDLKIKKGELPVPLLVDYLVTHILQYM